MRIIFMALALLLIAATSATTPKPATAPTPATAAPAAPSGGWQTLKDSAGIFSVEFPQAPAIQKQTSGSVATTVYAVNSKTWALMVIVSDMSSLTLDAKLATESAIASLVQGKVPMGNKPIKLGKHAGRVITASDANSLYTDQIYFFNHHLYQAISARPKAGAAEDTALADRFHKSFRLK